MEENNINKKYGIYLDIQKLENPIINDSKNIEKKYLQFIKENSFLFINKNTYKISIGEQHGQIKEDEHVIFKIEFEKDKAQLINLLYKNIFKRKEIFHNYINELDFKLYKVIPKYDNEKNFGNTYFLKKYDIIRMNKIKLILRDCKINNNKKIDDKNPKYIILFEDEKNEKCILCKKGGSNPENPLIKLCDCKVHFECKKREIKEFIDSKKMNNENCVKYQINTKCKFCKQIFPLYFLCHNKQFELLDIPKDNDFLLFESIDECDKYIFYIKLDINKNKEKILIASSDNKNEDFTNNFDKFMEIDNNLINNEKVMIECDNRNKTLALKNIGEENNISILQEKIVLKPNSDKLNINYANILIEAQLINNNKYLDLKKEIEKNTEFIEERK